MPIVNFGLYDYVPVMGTTEIDRLAYESLRPSTVEGVLPVFELTRHRGGIDLSQGIELVGEVVSRPFILDLDKRVAPPPYVANNPSNPAADQLRIARETQENNAFNATLNSLLQSNNGFENWRSLIEQLPNGVPVLQYTNPIAQVNAIIRQASLLSQDGNSIAIRITQSQSDTLCQIAAQIISALPVSSQLLIIFDCGQGRRGVEEKAAWVSASLQTIIAQIEISQIAGLRVVCMGNSFPQLGHSGIRIVENCDREIWESASGIFGFMFGDYAASHRLSSLSAFLPRSYRATVVHSQDNRWITHRHENSDDPDGWRVGCEAIVASGEFDPIESWTDDQIESVADGGLGDMTAPRIWHAARVSGHIERQFNYDLNTEEED